jgi:two-component system phosphate regulon sensor histidine kinase PhoR
VNPKEAADHRRAQTSSDEHVVELVGPPSDDDVAGGQNSEARGQGTRGPLEGTTAMAPQPTADRASATATASTVRRWASLLMPGAVAALVLGLIEVRWQIPTVVVVLGAGAVVAASLMSRAREVRAPASAERGHWRDRDLTPPKAMRVAIDALPDPCFLVDRKGLVRFANRAAGDQLGPIRIGDPLSFKLRVPVFLEAMERALTERRSDHIHWSEKVPTERWYEAYVSPFAGPSEPAEESRYGHLICVMVRDLTEQRRLERMREDFVANASHELRTPLASLTGFIETLQGPARRDEPARERFLVIMHDQAERMRRLIDDLLSLSQIEMRAHVRPKGLVDVAAVARSAVDSLKPVAADSGMALVFDAAEAPLWVRGEHDELVQVFDNLIENAIKYGATGERVAVFAERESRAGRDLAVVSVRDWGPGIPPEHLPRLTERFYRVDVATSRANKGTGLGLAIVKHILTRHRGRLSIHSQPGKGATFTIRLELEPEPGAASEAVSEVAQNQ